MPLVHMAEVQNAEGRGTRENGIWLPHVCTENEIAKIPAHTFLGLPNLEWLDLSKNKLDARGLHPHAFKVRSGPSTYTPRGPGPIQNGPRCPLLLSPPCLGYISPGGSTAQSTQDGGLG